MERRDPISRAVPAPAGKAAELDASAVPELVVEPGEAVPRSALRRLMGPGPIRLAPGSDQEESWIEIDGVGRFRFVRGDERVRAHPFPGTSAETVRAAYLATVLPLALQAAGRSLLHASAVETADGVVAFCGRSGSGKSTVAHALARRGLPQWADDAVLFTLRTEDERGPGPAEATTRRLPWRPRLRSDAAERWAGQDEPARSRSNERPLLAVHLLERAAEPGAFAAGAPHAVEPLRLIHAFPALLDNAYHFPAEDRRNPIAALAETYLTLATSVPTFRLTLPDGLDALETALDDLAPTLPLPGCH